MKKKRIVVCFDGTWQSLRQDHLTNVGLIASSVAHTETLPGATDHIQQIVIYSQGVGANTDALRRPGLLSRLASFLRRTGGGLFGEGLEDILVDAYIRLAFNYEAGDEIYIFGFSRGAFAARKFAGLVNSAGIVSRRFVHQAWLAFDLYQDTPPDSASDEAKAAHAEEERKFRRAFGKGDRSADGTRLKTDDAPPIAYLGVFDTVMQRGLSQIFGLFFEQHRRPYKLRNLRLCPNVMAARHAVAIDENGWGFRPTLWDNVKTANTERGALNGQARYAQRWFVGRHGDVGGGDGSKLAALALKWIAEGAAAQGLRFYATYGDDSSPLEAALKAEGVGFGAAFAQRRLRSLVSPHNWPIAPRTIWPHRDAPALADRDDLLDASVIQRALADHVRPRYRPSALKPFRGLFKPPGSGASKP
jgi:uncharacterized protein (DUF2235 family)